MSKSYTESSSQTVQIDPDNRIRSFKHLSCSSNVAIQTEPCKDNTIDEFFDDDPVTMPGSRTKSVEEDRELHRRLHPSRTDDFVTLQSELLEWRCREERKITKIARNAAHKREMINLLLRKELHVLRKIDLLKNSVTNKWKQEQMELMMEMVSKPKLWEVSNGSIIRVDTPQTYRARVMKSLYDQLIKKVDNGKY